MSGVVITSTGQYDKNGVEIKFGSTVIDPEGFFGVVLFINCAWRYDIKDGEYLTQNSSLLFSDSHRPSDFEVVNPDNLIKGEK